MSQYGKWLMAAGATALLATAVYAYPGYASGGSKWGGGCFGNGPQGSENREQITQADATEAVKEFLAANLKGFGLSDLVSYETPRATMYKATVTDDRGNSFLLHVNPFGYVRGPFTVRN
ncbi:hypothetical protein [Desulfurispira natronophila]|uniref:PepSY domain-containing protein n=1 Tax=Desulfurispira natronophila TaxID=682562 RepID=A0A7W8DH02_9BACT|nr:hypothetical protein [Desulfurispira natronophila]MBB5022066.1 hypothetical protein [Desulfurispira natronophila]